MNKLLYITIISANIIWILSIVFVLIMTPIVLNKNILVLMIVPILLSAIILKTFTRKRNEH
ncbi:hypothetical protein CLPU_18c00490 [Gottschalkia purinilytica]|uniref:Uncharacterized protein n=1 Tax=Gottschalkia purinilytica TaxID=1503 RepID=A0A0L0W7C1_GOTPU|nr:hypothetical protein [Gottschalkia purinilytica]KNF07367.1 hypothetical protein CLPU_18c00490 [Gottschalkia purinilytica]